MKNCRWISFNQCKAAFAVALFVLTAALMSESQAQIKQSLKVRVNASPAVSVARIDASGQRAMTDEMQEVSGLFRGRARSRDTIRVGPGFSISALENITVLLSFTTPAQTRQGKIDSGAVRITCGYLNDGTTYFRRANFSNKSPIQLRLRNSNVLKQSMQLNSPLFVAYVFFLIDQRKEDLRNESPLQVSTVTVEF
jgi:hypothetical protein